MFWSWNESRRVRRGRAFSAGGELGRVSREHDTHSVVAVALHDVERLEFGGDEPRESEKSRKWISWKIEPGRHRSAGYSEDGTLDSAP